MIYEWDCNLFANKHTYWMTIAETSSIQIIFNTRSTFCPNNQLIMSNIHFSKNTLSTKCFKFSK